MESILLIVFLIVACTLVALILVQHGKGADAGAAFGAGASATVFGSQGASSFLTRATAILATLFFILCLVLAYMSTQKVERKSVTDIISDVPVIESSIIGNDVPADMPAIPMQDAGEEQQGMDKNTTQ